ncbi:receptor-like protein 32 [Papaver somniferum]|uniref:receptor-like protein 32 n=1 Tax=Papaver somniferum TaxID=3469 RepID=UPI000E6F9268|nr:receptor-like protein 32 [Papaver somniferum]
MSQLRVLVLRSNKFYGPWAKTNFTMLRIIDISSNNFSGTLSKEYFSSWKAVMVNQEEVEWIYHDQTLGYKDFEDNYHPDTVTVTSKGLDMDLMKILTVFTSIDLSNNSFEGKIPEVIGNLRLLHVLNFSGNAFTGPIPSTIGNITQLESLDFCQNKLTGEIPSN